MKEYEGLWLSCFTPQILLFYLKKYFLLAMPQGCVIDHTDSGMEEKGRGGVQDFRWYKVAQSFISECGFGFYSVGNRA